MDVNCAKIIERLEKMPMRDLRGIHCKGPVGFKDFNLTKEEFNDVIEEIQINNHMNLYTIKEGDLIVIVYNLYP